VIAGHGRLEAAKLEHVTEVPVIVANGWSETQCQAYSIADNKLGEQSIWSEDLLIAELLKIKDELPFTAVAALGFEDKELARLLAKEAPDVTAKLTGLTYSVVVRCRDEQQQSELLERFEQEGLKCDALIS